MLKFLTDWAGNKAKEIMNSRAPDFVIGPKDDPYMLRWWAIPRNRFFNIYLHHILHDDDDRALHDHPWPSLSLMVEGGVFETYATDQVDDFGKRIDRRRWVAPGKWIYRGPNFAHRLELASYNHKPAEPATTIFMTGPRMREWGFLCPQGWRHWKDFVSQENKGEQGVGCGEVGITDEFGVFNDFHCRECGGGEIQLHNYDGYCRNCVEFSPYKRGPIDWSVLAIWGCGISASIGIWVALIYWWLS